MARVAMGVITWWLGIFLISTVEATYSPNYVYAHAQREIFVLNLEDGYFGCQVNESVDFLQLFELSKLCDGAPQCYLGSDEVANELKCTDRHHCHPKMPKCINGVCLDNLCYCNDGFGGKGCEMPDENECKYRPCDVFSHCTNTMGSFYCSCYPGYEGDGFECQDINECEIPRLAGLCVENSECCNLPGHYVCKCLPGYHGNATVSCEDVDECLNPDCCGRGAQCHNVPGSFHCTCPVGYSGDPEIECYDIDECGRNPCGPGALCANVVGGYTCSCPHGYRGNPTPEAGCVDVNECEELTYPCGKTSNCVNTPGSFYCQCPEGYTGNPRQGCVDINECPHACGANTECSNTPGSYKCQCKPGYKGDPYLSAGCYDEDECTRPNACGQNAECHNFQGGYECYCHKGYTGNPLSGCTDIDECQSRSCAEKAACENLPGSYRCDCLTGYRGDAREACTRDSVNVSCRGDHECTANAVCVGYNCQCKKGYRIQGIECVDVNECRTPNICGRYASCKNRIGTYECVCKTGFEKTDVLPQSGCRDINECLSSKFPCGANAKCINRDGSYECSCPDNLLGDPKEACKSPCDGVQCGAHASCHVNGREAACICDLGFTFDPTNVGAGCIDINECDISHGPSGLCGQGAICTNVPGSHHCSCPPGFTGDPFRYCEDINECDTRYGPSGKCGDNAVCRNTLGSFSCACPAGFTGNGRVRCQDINECSQAYGPNGKCGSGAVCTNTPGSFQCRCPPGTSGDAFDKCVVPVECREDDQCPGKASCLDSRCYCRAPNFGENCRDPCDEVFCGDKANCQMDHTGRAVCVCNAGYTGRTNSLPGCIDIDECSAARSPCGQNAFCRNIPGSFECVCPHGYFGDPARGCISNEPQVICSAKVPCPAQEECVITGKTHQCICLRGYTRDAQTGKCRDVNECSEYKGKSPCGLNAFCMNLEGSYVCHCPAGNTGNPYTACYPEVISCQRDNQCPGNTVCLDDGYQGTQCACKPPFVRDGEYCMLVSKNCSTTHPCPENQECVFTGPGYGYCICPRGFTLDNSGICRDINECVEIQEFSACGRNAECINSLGSYDCVCHQGYTGNPREHCEIIQIRCHGADDCPQNMQCSKGQCQCLPPFVLDGQTCRHPCDWKQCGQYASCVLLPNGPECQCVPGCTGNADTGCHDINECIGNLPIDPNGPCAVGATCINLLGGVLCECPPGTKGDPYKNGCVGSAVCSRDDECPARAACDSRAGGVCVDPCSTSLCGPNADCIPEGHTAICRCQPGFTGDPLDLERGCVTPCHGVYCGVNALCIVNSKNLGICQCQEGFVGNPWAGAGCHPDYRCSKTRPCGPGQDCHEGICIDRCLDVQCGIGARCNKETGWCSCAPYFIGDPARLCMPVVLPPICVPSCGVNAHCIYGTPNQCVCNGGYSGNPYQSCGQQQNCGGTSCGSNGQCVDGASGVDCICPAGMQGNPFIGCNDVNECSGSGVCGTGASCINSVGSFQCICPSGSSGNPLFACTSSTGGGGFFPPIGGIISGGGTGAGGSPPAGGTEGQQPTTPGGLAPQNLCYVNQVICGPHAFCTDGVCNCETGHIGDPDDPVIGCSPPRSTDIPVIPTARPSPTAPPYIPTSGSDIPSDPLPNLCEEDSVCDDNSACFQDEKGHQSCMDVCINTQCGPNAVCQGTGHQPACVCITGTSGDPNDLVIGCQPPRITTLPPVVHECLNDLDCSHDTICNVDRDNINRCKNVCPSNICGPHATCSGQNHRVVCLCPPGYAGDPRDLIRGCVAHKCLSDDDCSQETSCQAQNDGVKSCVSVCRDYLCGQHAICVGKLHKPQCECEPGTKVIHDDPVHGCQIVSPNICENNQGCIEAAVCRPDDFGVKDCFDTCENTRCGPNAQCIGRGHKPVCECLPGFAGDPYDFSRGCTKQPVDLCRDDGQCHSDKVCRRTETGKNDCIDPCSIKVCGPNAICTSQNHIATCGCPSRFSGDPNNPVRGCQPDLCNTDFDCSSTQACRKNSQGIKDCIDVCVGKRCGPNSECVGVQHVAQCGCKPGFEGNGENKRVGCRPRDKCKTNSDCPDTEICKVNRNGIKDCANPCLETNCGPNSDCKVSNHIPGCYCLVGYTGDAYSRVTGCEEIRQTPQNHCETDDQCITTALCRPDDTGVKDCYDACEKTTCGPHSTCIGVDHRPQCVCVEGFVGNPFDLAKGCDLNHECKDDRQCPNDRVCLPGTDNIRKCVLVCVYAQCSPSAICVGQNHKAICQCPPGYTGNPVDITVGCKPFVPNVCEADNDCLQSQVCKPNPGSYLDCYNACEFVACGPNAVCKTSNHRAKCECLPNHKGDPFNLVNGCKPPQNECDRDEECPATDVCRADNTGTRKCVAVCKFATCGENTRCVAVNHRHRCRCTPGFVRDPNNILACIAPDKVDECKDDYQCPTFQNCKTNKVGALKCAEVCIDFTCSQNSACLPLNHKGQCNCMEGYTGNPATRDGCIPIQRNECEESTDCSSLNDVCRSEEDTKKCMDACRYHQCGPNANCIAKNHVAQCQCPPGLYVGNAYDLAQGCRPVECLKDTDCPDNRLCNQEYTCKDPCIGQCGANAVCLAQNHQATCRCKPGYTGDAYRQGCVYLKHCESNPCHTTASCFDNPGSYTCQCKGDYIGDPYKGGVGCRHPNSCPNGDGDCAVDAACLPDPSGIRMCKNPCEPSPCGPNALCRVANHRAQCACPSGFRGSPEVQNEGCLRETFVCYSATECGDSQACVNGQCRYFCSQDKECALGEKCINSHCVVPCYGHNNCPPREACLQEGYCQAGCRSNDDCPDDKACSQNQCKNPCEIKGICGPNAICVVNNHEAACGCSPGFVGNPSPILGCIRVIHVCSAKIACPPGLSCVGERCRAPCSECANGEICINGACFVTCTSDSNCVSGELCLNQFCQVGCRTDGDCGINQVCSANRCTCRAGFIPSINGCEDINECFSNVCHPTAVCDNTPGSYICRCKDGDVGDGHTGCRSPGECPNGDRDCPLNTACGKDQLGIPKCINPCDSQPCGPNAECFVENHLPQCTCPKSGLYTGDPYERGQGCYQVECLQDNDCPQDNQCLNFECKNPCDQIDCKPYGTCVVRDRQAVCRCRDGYENKGRLSCVDVNECLRHPCHSSAICENGPGSFSCICPQGLVGNPLVHPGCHDPNICFNGDRDCADTAACLRVNGQPYCKDPCEDPSVCGANTNCRTIAHRPVCSCLPDHTGDARYRCEPVQCTREEHCKTTELCAENKCIDVCATKTFCGHNTICVAKDHKHTCKCLDGFYGDPIAGCRRILSCAADLDCPAGEFCYHRNCRTTCVSDRDCGANEGCEKGRCITICRSDAECPQGQSCSNRKCILIDRCASNNDCSDSQECRASPKGFNDCADTCDNVICAVNAICTSSGHTAVCKCREGYVGEPLDRGCEKVECRRNEDCARVQSCENYKCVDPCRKPNICGPNAFCVAQVHSSVCRCRDGYEGDPVAGCQPIDYCTKRPCHSSALCKNKLGGAECDCPLHRNIGNPYSEPGCRGPNECPNGDPDCPPDASCVRRGGDLPLCKNPCLEPNVCGVNALCRAENHRPFCYCPPEFTGNPQDYTRGCVRVPVPCEQDQECQPGLVCNHKRCKPPCREDPECAHKEICVQGHCLQGCREDPDCLGGEICIARKCIAGCRTNENCLFNEACILNSCKNPCEAPNVCGVNAICRVLNHEHECTCLPGFTGNPVAACYRVLPICVSQNDCPPNHFCLEGRCRVECVQDQDCAIGEQCYSNHCVVQCRQDDDCQNKEICIGNRCQVGCRSSIQCPDHLACVSNNCIDPCKGSATCGPNAECQVVNHRTVCSCPVGFDGRPNAYVGCIRKQENCANSNECRAGYVCFYGFCRLLCQEDRSCAVNERCFDARCAIQCQRDRDCPSGEICDENTCIIGCRSDVECPSKDSCINNQCIDPCASPTACGTNGLCRVIDHQKQCACPPGTSGDPYVSCTRVSVFCKADDQCGVANICEASVCRVTCSSDNECFDDEKCVERRCSVICTHDSACPDGYICEGGQCLPGCRNDLQCHSTQACINYQCRDPCASPTACGTNAQCQPVDHRPLCSCKAKYTGDPQVGCTLVECIIDSDCGTAKICQSYRCLPGCRNDQNCLDNQVCTSRTCQDPCQFSTTCGVNAICKTTKHKAMCSCPPGYTGNPILECQQVPDICARDDECGSGKSCINTRCIVGVECRTDDECHLGHICEATKCYVGCRTDDNCPLDKKCHTRQCTNPCLIRGACGLNAECRAVYHRPECTCTSGYFGNPQIECRDSGKPCKTNAFCAIGEICQQGQCVVAPGCSSDNDCRQGQICENTKCIFGCRSNSDCDFNKACIERSCQNPCLAGSCGVNAECLAVSHEAVCRCPAEYTGDPRQLCQIFDEECKIDDECGLGKICIRSKCVVGCRSDDHCPFDKACIEGRCTNPCHTRNACGIDALCRPANHRIDCSCPPNYSGDPKLRCHPGKKYQCIQSSDCGQGFTCENNLCLIIEVGCKTDSACNPGEICENTNCIVGCRRDNDCTFDKACIRSQCVNPCSVQNACGRNAQCRPVVHRPLCTCLHGHSGNAYDYCVVIPPQPSKECIQDKDCSFGKICEANRCVIGCRSNDNCEFNLACINRQCQDPCQFPEACGQRARCSTDNHHPVCSCPARLTGDPYIRCDEIPPDYCVRDSDCGIAQICESSRCIDACRTDDTCPYDKSCINSRCQNPCSFFGTCGENADCTPVNHLARCSCPPELSGDPKKICSAQREEVKVEGCQTDENCDGGYICLKGDCIEGCRTDAQCPPDQACSRRVCQDPCIVPGVCGVDATCRAVSHRPICSCLPGYVGDAQIECRLPQKQECSSDFECQIQHICEAGSCIIGCRTDSNCALEEACINGICQNPCSFYGACGRNAICRPLNHKPECACPGGFKGNPNVVCVPEVTPAECYKDSECTVGNICDNNNCIAGCRHDNNCPYELACINGQCQSPCLPRICGSNAECRPSNHRPICSCPAKFIGDPYHQCTLPPRDYCERDEECPLGNICENQRCKIGCRINSNCRFEEACITKQCQNPCSIFGACGHNAICKPRNHDRICLCPPGFTGEPKSQCFEIHVPPTCTADTDCPRGQICQKGSCIPGCRSDVHCPEDEACVHGNCQNPCTFSGVCGKDALCAPANHRPHCSCPSGFSGNPIVACSELRIEVCRRDEECAVGHICLKSDCIPGCRSHSNCPFDQACVNRFCQNPCDIGGICGVNTHCRAVSHQAICTCLAGYTGDPLRQCHRIEYECVVDGDCGSGFVCVNHACKDINECLKGRGPCALGAMCTNLPGSFRCTCPTGLVGDAYREGCRQPIPRCTHDADCSFSEACNLNSGECYDVCTKPGVCGRKAICKGINHRAECYCPSGLKGDPYVECVSEHTCGGYQKCPGNLQCLGDYCGCPQPFLQVGSFCILTSRNCTTNNPCNANEKCVYTGQGGVCVCPHGYVLMKNGVCRDLNECEEGSFPCGPGAQCFNTVGGYRCQCPPNTQGDPYNSGCQLPGVECRQDSDCDKEKSCDLASNKCFDPCIIKWPCGRSAFCRVLNHRPECACPPAFTGNPLVACYPLRGCKVDNTCPGNLICQSDSNCGCPGEFQRIRDFCILTSINCTTTNPCPDNQECVYTGTEEGFCVCPRGFRLLHSGVCIDIDECKETPTVCGSGAVCGNTLGSHDCRCPPEFRGDPYREGCLRIDMGCKSDNDCQSHETCDLPSRTCYDPCQKRPCGQNAICKTENHRPVCSCPPRFTGDALTYCLPILECGRDYDCPGNLVCLSTDSCGCPSTFQRIGDYCLLTSRNCTTTNPCPPNEDCLYTGREAGFCVCPRGYELLQNGICRDIDECPTPCAAGAICTNLPGSYQCTCPPETIGDGYVRGCVKIDVRCRSNDNCSSDKVCDTGSGNCISPCYECGERAICTVINHEAHCVCPPNHEGNPFDKNVGCVPEEPIETRTELPPSDLSVMCLADGVQVSMQLDGFDGVLYVKGHSQDPQCRRIVSSTEREIIDFKVQFSTCGLIHINGEASFILVIQKHPKLVTFKARAYHIKCVYNTGEKTITLGFNVSMITTSGTIANTGPPPTCLMTICTTDGKEISSAEIGDDLMLKVEVQPDYIYGGFARSCTAKTMEDNQEIQYEVTDGDGCATDPTIFGNWDYDPQKKVLLARFNAFKFPSSNNLRFQCNIRVCFGSCPPVNCDGVDTYGKRRRRQANSNDFLIGESFQEGSLREEIMVQSNAILTLERKESQVAPPTEGPKVEEIDSVCLPKLGLIISLVITTLLALVAVAVAISCWLMAYRRRPKKTGPLPHPPDFPNPLYTTPEPVAEPTPDYYASTHRSL